jgi:hypothetical protein
VTSPEILSELRNQETFDGVSIRTSEIDTGVLDITHVHERKVGVEMYNEVLALCEWKQILRALR